VTPIKIIGAVNSERLFLGTLSVLNCWCHSHCCTR